MSSREDVTHRYDPLAGAVIEGDWGGIPDNVEVCPGCTAGRPSLGPGKGKGRPLLARIGLPTSYVISAAMRMHAWREKRQWLGH